MNDLEKIIEKLEIEIQEPINHGEDEDTIMSGGERGILITRRFAKDILFQLYRLKL